MAPIAKALPGSTVRSMSAAMSMSAALGAKDKSMVLWLSMLNCLHDGQEYFCGVLAGTRSRFEICISALQCAQMKVGIGLTLKLSRIAARSWQHGKLFLPC
jgi:hypothetical protein